MCPLGSNATFGLQAVGTAYQNRKQETKFVNLTFLNTGHSAHAVEDNLSASMLIEKDLGDIYYAKILETLDITPEKIELELSCYICKGYNRLLTEFSVNVRAVSFYLNNSGIYIHILEKLSEPNLGSDIELKRIESLHDLHTDYRHILKQLMVLLYFNLDDFESRYSIKSMIHILQENIDQFSDAV